jgi:hypothetical protein
VANKFDQEDGGNPLGGVLRAAIGLAPIGVAAAIGFQRVKANAALNPLAAIGPGSNAGALKEVARPVGKLLRESSRNNRTEQISFAQKVAKDITQGDAMQALFSEVEQQRALAQSLLDVMSDPSLGFDQNQLTGYREKLVDLSREAISSDDAEEAITGIVRAISDQGTGDVKARWASNLREYQGLAPQLAPPTAPLPAGKRYNEIPQASMKQKLSKTASANYQHLIDQGIPGRQLEVLEFMEGSQRQFYAKFYGPGGPGKGRFQTLLPLDYGGPVDSSYITAREGEHLGTGYTAGRNYIDAQRAQDLIDRKGGFGNVKRSDLLGMHKGTPKRSLERIIGTEFLGRVKKGDGGAAYLPGAKSFGEFKRQFMAPMQRVVSSGKAYAQSGGLSGHIKSARQFQHNYATLFNFGRMGRQAREHLVQNVATVEGMEAGIPAPRIFGQMLPGPGQDFGSPIAHVGLRSGSAINAIQSIGAASRSYFPVVSRLEQAVGREAAFFGEGGTRTMGRGGVLTAGPTMQRTAAGDIQTVGRNIEWAESVTGATNKAVVLDVGGRFKGLSGTGLAYHAGKERVRHAYTKPILDPGSNNLGVTGKLFMDEVVGKAEEGKMVQLTRSQIKKYGSFLGIGPAGAQFLRDDPRMEHTYLGFEVTKAGEKQHVNLIAMMDRQMETYKGFSPLFKGTFQEVAPKRMRSLMNLAGLNLATRQALGLAEQDIVIADPGMMKKGAGFLDLQMRSGFGLVSGDANFDKTLRGYAKSQQYGALGGSKLARTTGAVIRGLSETATASDREIGMVLAGIFKADRLVGKKGVGPGEAGVGVPLRPFEDRLSGVLTDVFGEKRGANIKAWAGRGFALGATSAVQGAGVGEWARGRGSLEPRSFQVMQRKLRQMGMGVGEVSDVMADVYRNKVGYGSHLRAATGLISMAEQAAGMGGAIDAVRMAAEGVPTLGLDDLINLNVEGDMTQVFNKYQKGFMLDLTSTSAPTKASRAISSAAVDIFGQGQLFFPGAEVMDAMRETYIKTTGGNIKIQNEYAQTVQQFLQNINALKSSTVNAREEAASTMATFKKDVMQMASKVTHGVLGGKIRGSAFHVGGMYDLNSVGKATSHFSTGARGRMARDVWKASHGTAAFMDAKGFMSQLSDYMGSDAGKVSGAARKAERFFLSMEAAMMSNNAGEARGIGTFLTRHPIAGLGNVAPGQFFRHIEEVGIGDADEAFKLFRETEAGGALTKKMNLSGFKELVGRSAEDRTRFFKSFVTNLKDFAGEGGGRLFLPRMMEKVQYGAGRVADVDFGFAGAMIGDFDGDQFMAQMFNEKSGKSIMSTLSSAQKREKILTAENVYKARAAVFAEEMKLGLKSHVGKEGLSEIMRVQQDLLKESASKDLVGPLDIKLNKVRAALLDMQVLNPKLADQASEAMSMIHVMQEHAVIKGKKLPVFRDFAGAVSRGVDALFDEDVDTWRSLVSREIFGQGQASLPAGGILEKAMDIGGIGPTILQGGPAVPVGTSVSLQRAFETIERAVQVAKITNNVDVEMPSINQLAMALGDQDLANVERRFAALRAGEGARAGMIAGFAGDTAKSMAAGAENMFNKVVSAAGNMNNKMMGLAAGAFAVSMATAGIVSGGGYSPEPMSMPAEIVSPRVRNAISSGSFFGPKSTGPTPSQMQHPRDHYAMMDRPINVPSTYMNPQNGYKIRGQIHNPGGISSFNNYMSTMTGGGVRGSIRVNDSRRPITANYVDRMLGEY